MVDAQFAAEEKEIYVSRGVDARERELWQAFRSNTTTLARNRLVDFYTPKVRSFAAFLYARRIDNSVPFEDYYQYALCGMIEALERFDSARGVAFWTYASYRIQGTVLNGLRIATERHQMVAALNQMEKKSENDELSAKKTTKQGGFVDFIEATVTYAYEFILARAGSSREMEGFYESTCLQEAVDDVLACVETLPERERLVLKLHYFSDKSFEQLSDLLGVTRGRISQIHQRALLRVREQIQGRKLKLDLEL